MNERVGGFYGNVNERNSRESDMIMNRNLASDKNNDANDSDRNDTMRVRVKSLESVVRALGERNSKLNEISEELREENANARRAQERVEDRMERTESRVEIAERERNEYFERARELSDTLDSVMGELRESKRERERFAFEEEVSKERLRAQEKVIREYEAEVNALKIDYATSNEKMTNARADCTVLKAELEAYRWKLEASEAKCQTLIQQRDAFNGLDNDFNIADEEKLILPLVKGTQTQTNRNKKQTAQTQTKTTREQGEEKETELFVLSQLNQKLTNENSLLKQALANEEKMKLKALTICAEARTSAYESEQRCVALELELKEFV